jgi:hypothetical protein
MAATFAMYFGIAMGVFSGFGLLIGCLGTGRTRFNVCGAWKTRFAGRCCIILVGELRVDSFLVLGATHDGNLTLGQLQ